MTKNIKKKLEVIVDDMGYTFYDYVKLDEDDDEYDKAFDMIFENIELGGLIEAIYKVETEDEVILYVPIINGEIDEDAIVESEDSDENDEWLN